MGRDDLEWFSEPMLALYGTIFGGVGLKSLEHMLGRGKAREDLATNIRTELRDEMGAMRSEMEKLKQEQRETEAMVDNWRDKYYALLAAVATSNQEEIQKFLRR